MRCVRSLLSIPVTFLGEHCGACHARQHVSAAVLLALTPEALAARGCAWPQHCKRSCRCGVHSRCSTQPWKSPCCVFIRGFHFSHAFSQHHLESPFPPASGIMQNKSPPEQIGHACQVNSVVRRPCCRIPLALRANSLEKKVFVKP